MRLPRRLRRGETAELVQHLDELRSRLIIGLIAVVFGFAVAYAFHGRLLDWLNQSLPPDKRHPVTFGVAEPFMTSIKVSLVAGIALALPILLWQLWSFLAPAFDEGARHAVAGFTVFATGLFVAGAIFAKTVALPAALSFLTSYDSDQYDIMVRAQDYYSFAIMVLVAVGVVFELPVFILSLVRLRVVSAAKLRRNRRIGIVAMAALAVGLPGVDPVTTLFEMAPLMLLFEGSIWLAALFEPRWHTLAEPPSLPSGS